jgi:nucleoside-diphosphate-sugar epimerase
MKIVIAGGSGFIGRHVAQTCAREGFLVTILTRHPAVDPINPAKPGAAASRRAGSRRCRANETPGPHEDVLGLEHVNKVIVVDQDPAVQEPRPVGDEEADRNRLSARVTRLRP